MNLFNCQNNFNKDFGKFLPFKVKLATMVEGDQKAPFSFAHFHWGVRGGGRYFFPWIAPLYPQHVPYIAEC